MTMRTKNLYYNTRNDYNGGRERIGNGILLAKYLQSHKDKQLSDSLSNYIAYVERESFLIQKLEWYIMIIKKQ